MPKARVSIGIHNFNFNLFVALQICLRKDDDAPGDARIISATVLVIVPRLVEDPILQPSLGWLKT